MSLTAWLVVVGIGVVVALILFLWAVCSLARTYKKDPR